MPPLRGAKVVPSPIHGYGVVALRPFREGDIVTYGDGVIFRETDNFDDEYALILRNPERGKNGDADKYIYYDLTDQTRWINHSCSPNTEVDSSWDPVSRTMTTWWFAIRDIEPGEELTYDYAFSAHLAIPCRCRSPECRGLIVDEDEIDDVPEKMRGYIRRRRPAA
jgi:SET domain-containing protein